MARNKFLLLNQTKQDNKEEKKSNEEKALEECVEPNVNNFVATVYERKVYVGKVHDVDVDDSKAYIHFLTHTGTLNRNSKFRERKVIDDVWHSFDDNLCITPERVATKWALEICPEALDFVLEIFRTGNNVDDDVLNGNTVLYSLYSTYIFLILLYSCTFLTYFVRLF